MDRKLIIVDNWAISKDEFGNLNFHPNIEKNPTLVSTRIPKKFINKINELGGYDEVIKKLTPSLASKLDDVLENKKAKGILMSEDVYLMWIEEVEGKIKYNYAEGNIVMQPPTYRGIPIKILSVVMGKLGYIEVY
jgi:hypothetical protein